MRRQGRPPAHPSTFYNQGHAPLSNIPPSTMHVTGTPQMPPTVHPQHPLQQHPLQAIRPPTPMEYRPIPPPTVPQTPSSIPPNLSNIIQANAKQLELEQDKAMLELLNQLEEFSPIIPDELVEHYMIKAGLDVKDNRIKRLIALLTQKYVTDVAQNALQYSKLRQGGSGVSSMSKTQTSASSKRLILTMEDLASAMRDYDVHVKRPPYYR